MATIPDLDFALFLLYGKFEMLSIFEGLVILLCLVKYLSFCKHIKQFEFQINETNDHH